MGCSSSSGSGAGRAYQASGGTAQETNTNTLPTVLEGQKRRLTVTEAKPGRRLTVHGAPAVGATAVGGANLLSEEQQLLLQEKTLTMLSRTNGRSAGCGFVSSKTDFGTKTFNEKQQDSGGVSIKRGGSGIGYVCKKGLKSSPNQDSWCVLKLGDVDIYGVFDGHGADGHIISNLAKETLPKLVLADARFASDLPAVLREAFPKMHQIILRMAAKDSFDAEFSGSTGTMVVHDRKRGKLTVAHVGDSGSCIVAWSGESGFTSATAKGMTRDHKPEHDEERARIESAGGRIVYDGYANHRVCTKNSGAPGMNMSRALGDDFGHREAGISSEPEIFEYMIQGDDRLLLLCSDGVWEFQEYGVVATIAAKGGGKDVKEIAERLAKVSRDLWMKEEKGECVDDITALVVRLPPGRLRKTIACPSQSGQFA